MEKKTFTKVNRWISAAVAVLASLVYLATIEPTTSFWDCGEFIASSYKFEVGHPPGNPVFNLFAHIFTIFADKEHAAMAVNSISAVCSGLTIFFLYLSIVHFARRILELRGRKLTKGNAAAIFGAGLVGAFAFCFSDTFWFSAVEGEVYAMSSLFTAVVFWAILKWEEEADKPYSGRWIVLISFLMGLSIGVHLLNLLTIPAIVFIYYYKKHTGHVSFWKGFGILALSGLILGAILFGVIPYLPQITAVADRIFVNGFGAPFNTGAAFFMLLLLAGLFVLMRYLRKKEKAVLHTITLCFTTFVIGYSLFAITIIRSTAGTPTNEYQPDNPYTLIRYLGREQYGTSPLLYGQSFNSPYEGKEREYYTPLDGKYYKTGNVDAVFPAEAKMLFPRMWNCFDPTGKHKEFYKTYCHGYNTRPVEVYGSKVNVQMPKMSDNLLFFFDYQVNYMYVRYFMWNFVGRQNDFHGQVPGDLMSGNWESGIGFLDRARLGDQSDGPDYLTHNRSKNHYYFLPLLLGIIGLFFQLKHDQRNCWVTGLLFILTGFAIVIYLNQPPFQVRERDYAYAGSFYVFAIWIGLGVLALQQWMEKLSKKEGGLTAALAATVLGLAVPALMGCENWDDHDRSGRYTARDLAYNYLMSCKPNAILVTHGDNDTFPLWYAQEVEGIRTDIRIANSSLLGTDWYIDQMKCRFYDSEPLNITTPRKQYLYGTNDFIPVIDVVDRPVLAKEALDIFQNPKYVTQGGSDFIPAHKIIIPVNKENAIRSGIVNERFADRIEDSIQIEIKGNNISKFDFVIFDLLANYDWSRPLYFMSRGETQLGLDSWLQYDGFCYRLVPVRNVDGNREGIIDEDEMYDRIMNVYRFDSLADTTIHVDYQNLYTFCAVSPVREIFTITAGKFIDKGQFGKAGMLLDKCIESLPQRNFPYNLSMLHGINEWTILAIIEDYFRIGQKEKAVEIGEKLADESLKCLTLYSAPVGPGEDDVISKDLSEDAATIYVYVARLFTNYGETEAAERLDQKLQAIM